MSDRINFTVASIPKVNMNLRQDAVRMELEDAAGNIVQIGMTRAVASAFVAKYQTAFVAIDDQKAINAGTTPEERKAFDAESARTFVSIKAYPNPGATSQSAVLVKVSPGSELQQVFGLTIQQAEELAEGLATAASQARQSR